MNTHIDDLLTRMQHLEAELEAELARRRNEIEFVVENRRVKFAQEVMQLHRQHKVGLWHYLAQSSLATVLTAPVIYAGFIVFALMDLFVTLYQAVCFPVYGIPKARRSDYIVFDRTDLPYLNLIEKLNCFYCSYGNGVAAYLREAAARTEQYWCPIKHARRVIAAHDRYPRFFEYGDAQSYREGLERLRRLYDTPSGEAPAAPATPPEPPAEPPAA
ncbi:hypothetical protein [uncultured Sphaerotilus sp.]|uniref:hypothetical protein n=1 Tax=uncultured Sphaerotilus sp. TaxID=474984 RepID=UPI0030CA3F46